MKKAPGGFTLIELLVVIAIIALLSSVVLASLNTARAKGRNAKRADDIHQYQLALEFYYDKYGTYPAAATYTCLGLPSSATCWTGQQGDDTLKAAINEFFPAAPAGDTVDGIPGYIYKCVNTCSKYDLRWNLEFLNQKCTGGATPANAGNHTLCDFLSQ